MRALVAVLTLALTGRAVAQRAEAQDAFERGRKLMKDGDYPAACAAFETSHELEPATGTLYNLGLCHEKQGRIATAWAELKQVAGSDKNKERAADAAKRVASLEPRLTRMKLTVPDPVPGLAIERDGIDVTSFIDQPVPVDPRTYKFKVTAPGQQSMVFERALDKEGETIDVSIPAFSTTGTVEPAPIASDEYPRQLALRPVTMPNGRAEVTAANELQTSDTAFEQSPLLGSASARLGIQKFELGLQFDVRERYAQVTMERPNPVSRIGLSAAYAINPMFAGRLEYTRVQPIGDLGAASRGSDLRLALLRKLQVAPKIALDGAAGFLFIQRENGNGASELVGEANAALQFTATRTLSLEGAVLLDLNLGGQLLSHTVGLAVAPTVLFSATPEIDVFARISVGLLPAVAGSSSNDFRAYTIGLNWRP